MEYFRGSFPLWFCVLLLPYVHSQGVNFCNQTLTPSCICDKGLSPFEINCDGIGLTSIWEEEDWNVTLAALDLTIKDALYVTFVDNHIEHIPRLPALNITLLSFANNKIKGIESAAFLKLENLQVLNLAHNDLTSEAMFEGVFFGKYTPGENGYFPMDSMKRLNLSYNNIHSIPKNTFDHFTNLVSIDLSFNPLMTLEGNSKYAIGSLLKLEYLGLKNTSISGLPEGLLHDLNHLNAIDLSYNLFKTVPKLASTHELKLLDLNGNIFESLDKDSFQGLNYLEDLSISNVRTLRRVEQFTFGPLKNLSKLVLSYNPHLKDLDDGAFEGLIEEGHESEWPIKELWLNDNGLTQFDQGLAPWNEIDYIDIQNNPFRCDCNLGWMVLNLVERLRMVDAKLTVYLTCAEPKEMKGRSINSLSDEPELFQRCGSGGRSSNLMTAYNPVADDPYKAAGVTVLVIGILLIAIGLSILGFIVVKRRAIAQSLMAPSQIRYERAETEDGSEWSYRQQPSIHK